MPPRPTGAWSAGGDEGSGAVLNLRRGAGQVRITRACVGAARRRVRILHRVPGPHRLAPQSHRRPGAPGTAEGPAPLVIRALDRRGPKAMSEPARYVLGARDTVGVWRVL